MDVKAMWMSVAGVLLIAAAVLGPMLKNRYDADSGPAELRGAHLLALEDHRHVIVIGAVVRAATDAPRLEIIDAADGHRVSRVRVGRHEECVSASPHLLWCNTNYGTSADLVLRDAETLAVRVPHAKLVAGAPPLAVRQSPTIDARTGEAWFVTADGRFWHIDPDTLRGGIEAGQLGSNDAIYIGPNASPMMGSIGSAEGGRSLQFAGTPRAVLQESDGFGRSRTIAADTFLSPQFIAEMEGPPRAYRSPLAFEDGKVLIIAHDETMNHGACRQLISAVGLDGSRHWTTPLPHGEIRAGWIVDGRLVLATAPANGGFVTALDESDGHIVWRVGT